MSFSKIVGFCDSCFFGIVLVGLGGHWAPLWWIKKLKFNTKCDSKELRTRVMGSEVLKNLHRTLRDGRPLEALHFVLPGHSGGYRIPDSSRLPHTVPITIHVFEFIAIVFHSRLRTGLKQMLCYGFVTHTTNYSLLYSISQHCNKIRRVCDLGL